MNLIFTKHMIIEMNGMYQDTYSEYYPDIYRLVNPMVCKVCETNTQPITKELIEKMTDEVYMAIEDTSTTVNVRVNTPKTEENKTSNSSVNKNSSEEIKNSKTRTERNAKSISSSSNSTLRDLIKILILNQILGNRPGTPPPRPPRPPFPGGPGMPPPRPPFPGGVPPMIQPREYPEFL